MRLADQNAQSLGRAIGLTTAILAAALAFIDRASAQDQSPTPALPPAPIAEAAAATEPSATGSSSNDASASSGRSWSGPGQTKSPKSYWETIWPTIVPFPRSGNFYISPSGPGYYTLFDRLRGLELPNRPKNPYLQWGQNANPFFNVEFRYLDDPDNSEDFLFGGLKRIHLGDYWLFSTGGEIRDRFASLNNAYLFNKPPLAGSNENFNLFRARVYGDLTYLDIFRLFGEFTSAQSSVQRLPHLASDIDKADILNLFAEVKVLRVGDDVVYVRGGRQELLFGAQRVICPADWSNELRTFQGVRTMYHADKFEEDIWWAQPVIVNIDKLDSADPKQVFAGNYFKYRLNKDISFDLYYLYLENDNQTFAGRNGIPGGYDVNTVGGRFVGQAGKSGQYLWDVEEAFQFGNWSNQIDSANMFVGGIGYWFKNLPAIPTIWFYYDHASGTQDPINGNLHQTFNQLFPSGHSFFNSEDLFGRQNLNDFHLELGLFPANWMRFTFGYHILSLDQAKDALYSSSSAIVRQDVTGKSGTDVGNAINGTVQFHLDNHELINITYAHLFSGTYIKNTAVNAAAARDQDSVWFTYQLKW
jgi:hypothetical protein